MKKLLFIVAVLLTAVRANAQDENNTLISLLKVNFEGAAPKYLPTGDNPMAVEATAEGLALTHAYVGDSPKDFQIQVSDDCLTLQKKHDYFVRLTAKIPHKGYGKDGGYLAVQLGNEKYRYLSGAIVYGDDDFQVIEIEIPKFPYDIESDGKIIVDDIYVLGTCVIKDIELFEVLTPEPPVIDGMKLLCEENWEGGDYSFIWDGEEPDFKYEGTAEGLAMINPIKRESSWSIWDVVNHEVNGFTFSLQEHHNYIVRLTMKASSDGVCWVNLGSFTTNCSREVPVSASDEFLVVDVPFLDYWGDIEDREFAPIEDNARVVLGNGWLVGTIILKKVEVYEVLGSGARGGTTAIDSVKAVKSDGQMYNLAGQKVDASYKGIVIQNGRKRIVR